MKFFLRAFVAVFIVALMWTEYYRHYRILLANLRRQGDVGVVKMEGHLGDPTPIVVGHPLVSLLFVIDVLSSSLYFRQASLLTTEATEPGKFFLGCFYSSGLVCFVYFGMRTTCVVVKKLRVEHRSIRSSYQSSSSYDKLTTVETFPVALSGILLMASIPFMYSVASARLKHRRGYFLGKKKRQVDALGETRQRFASQSFNDLKNRLLWRGLQWYMPSLRHADALKLCASIHRLIHENPSYNKTPLLSCRAADCFVMCYKDNTTVVKVLRLVLMDELDFCSEPLEAEFWHLELPVESSWRTDSECSSEQWREKRRQDYPVGPAALHSAIKKIQPIPSTR
ncbi:hypothetical protein AC1031_003211 [Aphanomyces cochlioides]|nr:hypothetical protein AC1031_003211 [Aphanomyces cochlioides]